MAHLQATLSFQVLRSSSCTHWSIRSPFIVCIDTHLALLCVCSVSDSFYQPPPPPPPPAAAAPPFWHSVSLRARLQYLPEEQSASFSHSSFPPPPPPPPPFFDLDDSNADRRKRINPSSGPAAGARTPFFAGASGAYTPCCGSASVPASAPRAAASTHTAASRAFQATISSTRRVVAARHDLRQRTHVVLQGKIREAKRGKTC